MPINLSNLKISLDKFNTEASGTYNIGQMKLSSNGKSVYRTNNHKTWTILNRTKISSEEALAVKFAFCQALSKEGLSKEAINEVKTKLGIPGNALDALKAGNIKPLTAAEVREVIDKYAAQINQHRASVAKGANGVKVLKTSNELYRGVDKGKLDDRATARNEINANSIGKMMTGADKAINNILDILQFTENTGNITSAGKKLANEILLVLSNRMAFTGENGEKQAVEMATAPVTFTQHDNGNIVAKIKLKNGNSFSIDTGLDRNALVDKATNVLNWAIATKPPAANPHVEKKFTEDDVILQAINELESGEVKTKNNDFVMDHDQLINGLKNVFNALKEAVRPAKKRALRNANMEDVVKALQQTLDKARHLDNRNTKLINDVREVFYGNQNIDTDKLLKEISDALTQKRVNPEDKVKKNILNKIEDDLDKNLNINAFLEENDIN